MNQIIIDKKHAIGTACTLCLYSVDKYCAAINRLREKKEEIEHTEWMAQDYREKMINQEIEKTQNTVNQLYEEIRKQIDIIEENSMDLEEFLSIDDGELQGALLAVQTMGKDMPDEIRRSLVEKFRGQQKPLAILKSSFDKAGISTKYFDELIFSADSRIGELDNLAWKLTVQPGKDIMVANAFARSIEKFAVDLGVTLGRQWDSAEMGQAFIDSLRQAVFGQTK